MTRRLAARACNWIADLLFMTGDRFVRLGFRIDPVNALARELVDEAAEWDQGRHHNGGISS
jgi:hypothetical protein